jgi:hypothetical protein
MTAMCIERMEREGAAAGPPVICWAHVQGLGRGQAASYGVPCTNQAAEFNFGRLKEQSKAEAGAPPMLIQPIQKLDQQRLISSKVSSICCSLYLSSHCGPQQCPGPPTTACQQASSIKDNTPSGASLDFSVGSIYNSTHTSCCLLLKTQVPRAAHRYSPLDVCRASALTLPSTCTRHSHVPEVTYPPHLQPLHRRHHHLRDSRHSMIPPSQSKTLSCRFDRSKQDTVLPIRTHAAHAEINFLTEFSENDHPPPPPAQETEGTDRRMTTGRSSGHRRGKE